MSQNSGLSLFWNLNYFYSTNEVNYKFIKIIVDGISKLFSFIDDENSEFVVYLFI